MDPAPKTDPWEYEYSRKGRLWGGAVHHLPEIPREGRILELGCGDGKTYRTLLERDYEVIGIDRAASALNLCRSLAPLGSGAQFARADACSLPFADGSFSSVIAFHVIGHLPDEGRARAAREASRVIRNGGMLFFSGFSCEDFRAGAGSDTEPGTVLRKNGIATHYFSEEEVLGLFCRLHPLSCITRHWVMTIRGQPLPRAEIAAAFTKTS